MATETTKYATQTETEAHHSALQELYRDERHPALLLLGGLVIAVIFFALGIMVGRWVGDDTPASQSAAAPAPQTTPSPAVAPTTQLAQTTATPSNAIAQPTPLRDPERRYTLIIATYATPEEAQPLVKRLEQAGYTDVRISTPRAGDRQQRFSILLGRYKRDEADRLAARMRATNDPRLRNVRVIEDGSN